MAPPSLKEMFLSRGRMDGLLRVMGVWGADRDREDVDRGQSALGKSITDAHTKTGDPAYYPCVSCPI
jgi:hypothetical protein